MLDWTSKLRKVSSIGSSRLDRRFNSSENSGCPSARISRTQRILLRARDIRTIVGYHWNRYNIQVHNNVYIAVATQRMHVPISFKYAL